MTVYYALHTPQSVTQFTLLQLFFLLFFYDSCHVNDELVTFIDHIHVFIFMFSCILTADC